MQSEWLYWRSSSKQSEAEYREIQGKITVTVLYILCRSEENFL
jgi:hypothetical protein